jgi:hypothetical protein
MYRHKFIDVNGKEFYWYSVNEKPIYNVLAAAQAWFDRALILA